MPVSAAKDQTLQHVLEILDSHKQHIDRLERQVEGLTNNNTAPAVTPAPPSPPSARPGPPAGERLQDLEEAVGDMKGELLELMRVYEDVQDKLFDIDRSWQNTLVFHGLKQDANCGYESSECTEAKVREVLRMVLNMRRDIQFLRVLRVYNGPDCRGPRPIIVCFSKWTDKEEVLRKGKILKAKGLHVEEDLSRAARSRRRELEKLMKSIKAREPERRCFLKFDKLIVDDNAYIYNDLEGRVEKLPHKVHLSTSSMDLTDSYNDTNYNYRSCSSIPQMKKGLSVESLLEKIPASLGPGEQLTYDSPSTRLSLESLAIGRNGRGSSGGRGETK